MRSGIKKILQLGLAACLLLTAGVAVAQKTDQHPVLQKILAAGGKVDFLGNAYGMDGWLVTNSKSSVQYAYTTPEGALLIGMLFAPDGTLETRKQISAYKQKTAESSAAPAATDPAALAAAEKASAEAERFYAATEKANWVSIGDSQAPYLYMFINVTCDHCQNLWKDLESSVAAGKLQVRFLPYGVTENNRDSGAALLSAERPDEAWRAYLAGDMSVLGRDKVKEEAYLKIDANTFLAEKLLIKAPLTLYRRPATGVVTAVLGRPENIMLLLADFLK